MKRLVKRAIALFVAVLIALNALSALSDSVCSPVVASAKTKAASEEVSLWDSVKDTASKAVQKLKSEETKAALQKALKSLQKKVKELAPKVKKQAMKLLKKAEKLIKEGTPKALKAAKKLLKKAQKIIQKGLKSLSDYRKESEKNVVDFAKNNGKRH